MRIENGNNPGAIKKVFFSGRKAEQWIEVDHSPFDDRGPNLNISVNLQLQDVEEFIKAVQLAAMIASGELETE